MLVNNSSKQTLQIKLGSRVYSITPGVSSQPNCIEMRNYINSNSKLNIQIDKLGPKKKITKKKEKAKTKTTKKAVSISDAPLSETESDSTNQEGEGSEWTSPDMSKNSDNT